MSHQMSFVVVVVAVVALPLVLKNSRNACKTRENQTRPFRVASGESWGVVGWGRERGFCKGNEYHYTVRLIQTRIPTSLCIFLKESESLMRQRRSFALIYVVPFCALSRSLH